MTRKIAFGLALGSLLTALSACGYDPGTRAVTGGLLGAGTGAGCGGRDRRQARDGCADRRRRRCGRRCRHLATVLQRRDAGGTLMRRAMARCLVLIPVGLSLAGCGYNRGDQRCPAA